MRRIGVFICHCGSNIAGTVDVEAVAERLRGYPGFVHAIEHEYVCSDPGQELVRETIRSHRLEGIVVAACSPAMHQATFRRAARSAGLNAYLCEMANIREQCSWVHQGQPKAATQKAMELIHAAIERVRRNEALEPLRSPLTRRALVIGGGLAGLTAALEIAEAGYPVILVEREEELGGRVAQVSRIYPGMEPAGEILRPRIDASLHHPQIEVLTAAEVEEVSGYIGNFRTRTRGASTEEVLWEGEIGAIIVATGYGLYPLGELAEYGAGLYPDVIDALTFESLLGDAEDGGELRRPSDGRVPRAIAFVQCAGSRDPERGLPYCSNICCMYTAKQALSYKQLVPQGQAYVFYIDIRSPGRAYEGFVQEAVEAERIIYLRGKVAKIFQEDGRVMVWGVDTLVGRTVEVTADMAVVASAVVPSADVRELARRLRIPTDEFGFLTEAHPKLRPVESPTAGIYLAGMTQGPKGIAETVAQATAAAAKVLSLFSQPEMVQEPLVANVDRELCTGCEACISLCPYGALSHHTWRKVAVVNEALCQGCGHCAAVCPSKACQLRNSTPSQLMAMIEAMV